eukprot:8853991-Pyramimonas_sp.AAC.1
MLSYILSSYDSTSFYGSSCANNSKDALNTPDMFSCIYYNEVAVRPYTPRWETLSARRLVFSPFSPRLASPLASHSAARFATSPLVPITVGVIRCGYILTSDQSDAGSVGMFSRRTNRTSGERHGRRHVHVHVHGGGRAGVQGPDELHPGGDGGWAAHLGVSVQPHGGAAGDVRANDGGNGRPHAAHRGGGGGVSGGGQGHGGAAVSARAGQLPAGVRGHAGAPRRLRERVGGHQGSQGRPVHGAAGGGKQELLQGEKRIWFYF